MARTTASHGAAELPDERPPGPDGLPFLGNTLDLYRDPWAFYDRMAEYGDVVGYSAGGMTFTALLHPDHVERVLLTDHERFGKWGFEDLGGEFAAEGLLLAEGEQWRRQRTLIQEAFTMDRIRAYGDAMGAYAAETVASWDDGEELALNEAFSRLTLRILARSLFDLDLEADARAERVTAFAAAVNERGDVEDLSAFVPLWVPIPSNRRYRRALDAFRAFVDDLIAERRGEAGDREDLLSLLLAAGGDDGGLTETEIRDDMATFLFAGHETTALALTYACMSLATHDDVRRRLDAEHEAVLGGDVPSVADVGRLPVTERVITETLRLYPPAYITFREAREDVGIGGYLVPEGSKLSLPQFHVHRDGRFYDDPEAFRPGRWTDGFEEALHDYAYFPFGGGPRHCIGMRFADLELKTVLPTIAQHVEFELLSDPEPAFSMGATLRPAEDVRVRVHRRD
jgi:cytochrome P450